MTRLNEVYKCNVCGNIVELVHASTGTLVCCGQSMELLKENTLKEEGKEKHVPIVEITKDKIIVKIGSIPHPMEEKHYIEWIEIIADGKSYKQYLKPGQKPEAEFCITANK
ncbi:MAG: desulfoferrodoxin, partial [Candidatus Nanoarchaeia archaeon]|nr:desulfoferrodoxin [Candidatus Nanoarchaeia archaeon]